MARRHKSTNNMVIACATSRSYQANRIFRQIQINGRKIKIRLDTGADITLLSNSDWAAMSRPKLLPSDVSLRSANNSPFDDWTGSHRTQHSKLTQGSINSVSASTLHSLRSSLTANLQRQFATVFASGLGRCTKSKVTLKLIPVARPVFRKARPVPYAHLSKISKEIDRLVKADKKNGTIRLCADFSTGLNDSLEHYQHSLPTPDEIFTKLNGGHYFTQLDLSEAYLQLEVDEESKPLLTINTNRGLLTAPLLSIFGSKKGFLSTMLSAFSAGPRYCSITISRLSTSKRKFGQVDFLSHLIASNSEKTEDRIIAAGGRIHRQLLSSSCFSRSNPDSNRGGPCDQSNDRYTRSG
ncbi:unnamed protein product [Nippostrongylus brasiliensis]|uniref:Peptidase A2 domain-containing protein n=1 Tax=Nippostrongylus brasiliensis TaxID=27835 RepID=A0A0N4YLV1_NIPBR|nr:unnamed protein product [Nippostrongylus brasiliensis]